MTSRNLKRAGILGLTVSCVFLIAACSGGSNSSADEKKPPTGTEPTTPSQPVNDIINGIKVPPLPDPKINDATQAGVDSNSNGIRDDVERLLVKEFGANKDKYDQAVKFAVSEQNLIVKQDEASINEYINAVSCSTLEADEADKMTYTLLNTTGRANAYGNLLAGRGGSMECK